MPGLAVSLADALKVSTWEEEPLKVELPLETEAREEDKEPLKVELPLEAEAREEGEEPLKAELPSEEPQKIAVSPRPSPWDSVAGCLAEPSFISPVAGDCMAGCLGESPLASPYQLAFHSPLSDGWLLPGDGQDRFMSADPSESPLARAHQLFHMHLPEVPALPLKAQEPECSEAFPAWNAFYDVETAAPSPATSAGSDYEYNPEAEPFYPGCFDPMRSWDPMQMLPGDSQHSLEASESPLAPAHPLLHGYLPEVPPMPLEAQDGMPLSFEELPVGHLLPLHYQLPMPEAPVVPDPDQAVLPSRGSALHGTGECKPCAWFYKSVSCQSGIDCDFCHLCPEGMLKAKKKSKQAMKRRILTPAGLQDDQARFPLSLASLI